MNLNKLEKFNAPAFKNLEDNFRNSRSYKSSNPGFRNKIKELCKVFSIVEPYNKDWHSIWVVVPRGNMEDFSTFEDAKDFMDVETYEEYENLWKEFYPQSESWFKIGVAEVKDYLCVGINNSIVFEYDPSESDLGYDSETDEHFAYPHIDAIIHSVTNSIELLKNGTYNQYVKNNLPLIHRTGTISGKDFWKGFPNAKENTLEGMSKSDCNEFISLMQEFKKDAEPSDRLDKMTADLFFECCSLGYEINDYIIDGLTPKEQYKKYADGRDAGLLKIDSTSFEEYENWRNDKNRFGGHPWEVMRGGNSTHVDFYPCVDDKGYYFMLRGDYRKKEVAMFYLALHRKGIPVGVINGKQIANAFAGTNRIGIVPNEVFPRYCHEMFPNEDVIDFVNIYDDEMDLIKDYVTWYEIPEIHLVDNTTAISKAQKAFEGVAEQLGVENEDDVQKLIDEVRHENDTTKKAEQKSTKEIPRSET